MLAASFGLLYEGVAHGLGRTLAGALTGLVFIVGVRRLLQRDEHPAVFAGMGELDARKALLMVGVMTIHSFTEGVGVGVSFGGGIELGLFITLAIAVHNIPEGLAISLVLVPRVLRCPPYRRVPKRRLPGASREPGRGHSRPEGPSSIRRPRGPS